MDYPESGNQKMQKIAIAAGVGFLVLILFIFIVVNQLSRSNGEANESGSPTPISGENGNDPSADSSGLGSSLYRQPTEVIGKKTDQPAPAAGVIAKVGEELIYNSDLTREAAAMPNSDDPTVVSQMFEKLVADSVTLQGAAKEGFITLDGSTYNSANKDYSKRIALVATAKKALEDNADGYTGAVVSIWFNNQRPGEVGYAQGKQIAFNKITQIHNQVKAGTMTMLQASDAIVNDESLAKVDPAYKVNSYEPFVANAKAPATFMPEFNAMLSKLKAGEVSALYLGKAEDENGRVLESLYIFGKVDKVLTNRGYKDYADWFNKNKSKYEVIRY